ncbi:MAG: DUF362 domain-containing protein [Candidatus Aminicenantia bacterium]
MRKKIITRRDFFKVSAGLAISGFFAIDKEERTEKSSENVILIRDKNVYTTKNTFDRKIIQRILDEGLMALTGENEPLKAWKRIIKPDDMVGIKSNVWAYLPTPSELEDAIVKRVMDVGVSPDKIAVDDRRVLRNKVFQNSTALINVRPLRTHHWAGIGGCIKNYIMFLEMPFTIHPDSCAELGSVWQKPIVKGKTRLNILVAFRPLFHGIGPHHYSKSYVWDYKGLILGFQPATVDSVGVALIMRKRMEFFGEEKPLYVPPKHVYVAGKKYGLGETEISKIKIEKLGWQEGILI